jgi:predicted transcriptional regulator
MRTVKNVLASKAKPFNNVTPQTVVFNALSLLNSINLSYLVVMEGDMFRGIFSERDYSRKVILQGRHSDSTTVAEVMSTDVPTVNLADTVEQCMHLMNQHKSRYLVAFDADGNFAGVVTIHDILRQVISSKEDVFDRTLAEKLVDEEEGGDVY